MTLEQWFILAIAILVAGIWQTTARMLTLAREAANVLLDIRRRLDGDHNDVD